MPRPSLLFANVFVVAVCGLVYELLAGTLASYVLGDSVTQFSLVIGIYLSAMGVGAWLSRFVEKGLARRFVEVESAVALLGGLSAPILYLGFGRLTWFSLLLYGVVFAIGVLVGLEIPLLMRILKESLEFKEVVSKVLAFDYVGALVASLLFPLFLVPRLGLTRTSLLMGILNGLVAFWGTWLLRSELGRGVRLLRLQAGGVVLLLGAGFAGADRLATYAEADLFPDEIVRAVTTPYQRIVVTQGRSGFSLYLNGNLQFHSVDEYRYHEALAHPAMAAVERPRRVLILGGGDGLALREVLRYPDVASVTLVDLDPGMTDLSRRFPPLAELNARSFEDPRVTVVNRDAMLWIEEHDARFDVVIADFPDPNSFALGKLYTRRFYRLLAARLAPGGAIAVQAGSPLFARRSFWCIVRTLESAGWHVAPYQVAVPSFGVWGFVLARPMPFDPPERAPEGLRFLDDATLRAMFTLPPDLGPVEVEVNRLDNQALVRYYEDEWRRWER